MKSSVIFKLMLICLLFPAVAAAETAMEFYNGNRLYEALAQLENEKKEDHYALLKAKIYQKLGEISKGLYYLGKKDLRPYLKNSKGLGSKADKFSDEIRRSVKEKEYEKAFQTIRKFQNTFSSRSINNSVSESIQYYSPKLYAAMARTYYEISVNSYLAALNSLKKREDIDRVNALIGECLLEIAEFDAAAEYYARALEYFKKPSLASDMNNPSLLHLRIWFCNIRLGRKAEAQGLIEKLGRKALNDPVFKSELGDYMIKANINIKEAGRNVKEAYESISGLKTDRRHIAVLRNFASLSKTRKSYSSALSAIETARDVMDAGRAGRNDLMDPVIAVDLVGVYMYPRRFGDALRLLYDLHIYYPEAGPVWNIMKDISEKQGYGG